MKQNLIGLDIDERMIQDAIQQTTAAAIVEMFDSEKMSSQIVKSVLDMKVDSSGRPSTSSYDKQTYLQHIADKMVREEVHGIMQETIEKMRPKIHEAVENELQKKSTMGNIVASFVDSVVSSIKYTGLSKIDVSFVEKKDEYR